MPLVTRNAGDLNRIPVLDQQIRKEAVFRKKEQQELSSDEEEGDPLKVLSEADDLERAHSESASLHRSRLASLASETADLPLEKLIHSPAGCKLFDELCLRIDVNQKYAESLPQWTDVADRLEVDALRTRWVETCVRPQEGLTRAMLEIYMRDGGTLGDVLKALVELECDEILEKLEPKVREYIKDKTEDTKKEAKIDPRFFSILSTLAAALGSDDPCIALQKFSNGIRTQALTEAKSHDLTVQNVAIEVGNESVPKYDSSLHLKKGGKALKFDEDEDLKKEKRKVCRILLLFADDGVQYSDQVYDLIQGMEFEGVTAEVFRLNESSLWYELLVQPEACCLKWANEADYVMPILTPNLLKEFHGTQGEDEVNEGSLVPTSPVINRYMYTLLRARFVDGGCKNTVVRPVVPAELTGRVGGCTAVKRDPLLRLVWVPLKEERVGPRVRGMLGECAKKRFTELE